MCMQAQHTREKTEKKGKMELHFSPRAGFQPRGQIKGELCYAWQKKTNDKKRIQKKSESEKQKQKKTIRDSFPLPSVELNTLIRGEKVECACHCHPLIAQPRCMGERKTRFTRVVLYIVVTNYVWYWLVVYVCMYVLRRSKHHHELELEP